ERAGKNAPRGKIFATAIPDSGRSRVNHRTSVPRRLSLLPGLTGPGGGRVGAVVLSKYVRPGTIVTTPYNHYSLLRTIEDLFGLSHLGFAGQGGLLGFGLDVFVPTP